MGLTCCTSCGASYTPPTCGSCGATIDPATGRVVAAPGVCTPGPSNTPITDDEYQRSLGVCLQPAIDAARRLQHELGLRPYRVKLVWVERDRRQRYSRTVKEIELTPVAVSEFTGLGKQARLTGMDVIGELVISEISPAQVNADDLQGRLDGQDPPHDVRFFIEIEQTRRCDTAPAIRPGRYTPASLPSYDGEGFSWAMAITTQIVARAPDGADDNRDQVFDDDTRRDDGMRF